MPKLGVTTDGDETWAVGGTNFTFSAARIGDLGATEYTLACIAVDITGSVYYFANELLEMLRMAVTSLKKSPRSDNLLVRVVLFSSDVGIRELHGYKPLSEVDPASYQPLSPGGLTNLFDAAYDGIGSLAEYGGELMNNDFLANGILIVITDGGDNASTVTTRMIKTKVSDVRVQEKLESVMTILIGINATQCATELATFQRDAELDNFIDAGDATPGKLAKVAGFISNSVTSTSQSLGTGGPSQTISATI